TDEAATSGSRVGDLLNIDPEGFDALDELLAQGASSATGASGSFRRDEGGSGSEDRTVGRGTSPSIPAPEPVEGATDPGQDQTPGGRRRRDLEWSPSGEEVVWTWTRLEDLMVQEWTGRSQAGGAVHGA
ncbi:MAG: hypothetical protein HKO53_10645, partial [Gemmatimonadetes bacterium]|nr:hypothetical protein [Gemmatimonadota bacterium]